MKPVYWMALTATLLLTGCSDVGKDLYQANCAGCHAGGLAGAPAIGDPPAWRDRLAQGEDRLVQHSIGGYTCKDGIMPARGGNDRLTDDEVRAAVRYMIRQSD